MKRLVLVSLSLMLVVGMIGCSANTSDNIDEEIIVEDEPKAYENLFPEFILGETDTTVTYIDKFGEETVITKSPQKVAVLFNSILGLWYYMGGESMVKVKGTTNVPEEAMELTDLGSSHSVSLEAIVALEPDLVIIASNVSAQVEMAPTLSEMGIETMIIDTSFNSYERFKENAYLFSKVIGTEDSYFEKINPIVEEVDGIIAKVNNIEEHPKVAAIFTTSKKMSLESDIALVGEMVYLLGGDNILKEEDILAEGETRVPFSIEALIAQNPDIIMFSTMGDIDAAMENINGMIGENPAWEEINAVKNDRVYYLPKEFSIYKPNERYNEAFVYIANILYPEQFEGK